MTPGAGRDEGRFAILVYGPFAPNLPASNPAEETP